MKIKNIFLYLLVFYTSVVQSADMTKLFSYAVLGETENVKLLLADNVDVNALTKTGRTAMMAASFNGNIRIVKILLGYGANVNISDHLGSTALMDAVIYGSEKLVKLLITAGANVNAVDKNNISVVDKAKKTRHSNIVKILEKEIAGSKDKSE